MQIFAERMKKLRLSHGYKQTEVAQAVKLSISAYCRYEYGQREPTASTIRAFAEFYQVSADYLLGLSERTERAEEGSGKRPSP